MGKSAEKIKNDALKYLNERYEDTFTPVWLNFAELLEKYDTIVFKSEKYDDTFYVYREKEVFTDEYFKLQIDKSGQEYFKKILDKYSVRAVIRLDISSREKPEELSLNPTFEEYLNCELLLLEIIIFTEEEVSYETQIDFLEDLVLLKINSSVEFISIKISLEEAEKYSEEELRASNNDFIKTRKFYIIDKNLRIDEF